MSAPEAYFSLRQLPALFWRHKGKMILFALVVMGGTVLGTVFGPHTYRSEAKLLVRLWRENTTVDPTATLGQAPVVAVPIARENEINSILEELTSRNLIVRVVDSVGPEAILGTTPPEPTLVLPMVLPPADCEEVALMATPSPPLPRAVWPSAARPI